MLTSVSAEASETCAGRSSLSQCVSTRWCVWFVGQFPASLWSQTRSESYFLEAKCKL